MNTNTEQDVWYLARDGKQHGPISQLEMSKLVEFGHLRESDLVWKPGFADWRAATSVFPPAGSQPPASPAPVPAPAVAAPYWSGNDIQHPAAEREVVGHAEGPAFHAAPYAMEHETALQPNVTSGPRPIDDMEAFPIEAPPRRRGLVAGLVLTCVAGGLAAGGYVYQDAIKATMSGFDRSGSSRIEAASDALQQSEAKAELPNSEPPPATPAAAPPAPSAPAAPQSSPQLAIPMPQVSPLDAPGVVVTTAFAPQPPVDTSSIDAELQKQSLWVLLKSEFPDWYSERLNELGRLSADKKPEPEVNAKLIEGIVALRRKHADQALAASSGRLQDIAKAFIESLTALRASSVDACYGFISKGEMTPAAVALIQKPAEGQALHAQLQAVFTAVAEGRKSPAARNQPQKSDYDLLAAELGLLGWSQDDIKLFADPKALSEAPRERVCTMVRDWFSAHLSVKDGQARERLLFETLRPVVAG